MTRRSPGEGSLYKRADGYWVGAIEIPNLAGERRRRTVTSKSRAEAVRKLNRLRAELAGSTPTYDSKTTVNEWLTHWLEEIHRPKVRPTTYRYYRLACAHINEHLGGKRLTKLTADDVRRLHTALWASGSTRTALAAHQALQLALKDAEREGLLSRNVAALAGRPRHAQATRGALTAGQARELIRAALDGGDPLASRWAAAFLTGARKGELLGLEWDRVDLDTGLMDLSWQLQEHRKAHGCNPTGQPTCGRQRAGWCPQARWDLPAGYEHRECHRSLLWTRPKSAAGTRIVPIIPPLRILLEDLEHTDSQPNPHNLVWHHQDGRPISPREDHRLWTAALDRAGLDHIPLHCARHTTATLLHMAGVSEDIRMQIMGQSSAIAQRGYVHVDQTLTRAALLNLGGLLEIERPVRPEDVTDPPTTG